MSARVQRIIQLAILVVMPCAAASAQERPVRWSAVEPRQPLRARQGERLRIGVVARIDTGWKLYSLAQQSGGPIATNISLGEGAAFTLAGDIAAPQPESYPDRNFNIFTEIYTASARFTVPVRVRTDAPVGKQSLPILVRFQTCTERYCLPPRTDTLGVTVLVLRASARAVAAASAIALDPQLRTTAPTPTALASPAAPPVVLGAPTDLASLARFVWLAITMGLLSLLTPCVLPMIPITVGYFSSGGPSQRRTLAALTHAFGIVAAFTLLGFAVAVFFGAGGIVRLAASPWLNIVIAALFIAFALNLLGVFEITLPQRLLAGITRVGAHGQRHAAGALLMGSAFALTSFTCTVPFVGTLLVLATQGSWRWPLVGLAAYGAAFALPFFLVALTPRMLERLPRSGPWMMVLKGSLGIVELALAIKFLSNVDLVLGIGVLTRDVVIWLWIAAALAIALLFIGFPWVHREAGAARRVGLGSVAGAVAATAVAAWLAMGLRGERLGELEAYLPPPREGALRAEATRDGSARFAHELPWMLNDYDGALALARTEQKPVLLDFTGYTCTNCRWMEANMFPRTEVRELLDRYVRVRLFTDGLGEPYESQQKLQQQRFGTVALPYYAALDNQGAPLATFLGMTRDSREFSEFLQKALRGTQ